MVVEEDRVYSVANNTVRLATADVYGKDRMYDRKHQEVQLRVKEASNPKSDAAATLAFMFLLVGFGGWQVWLGSSQPGSRKHASLVPTSKSFILSSGVRSLPPIFSSRLYNSLALVLKDILKLRFAVTAVKIYKKLTEEKGRQQRHRTRI